MVIWNVFNDFGFYIGFVKASDRYNATMLAREKWPQYVISHVTMVTA